MGLDTRPRALDRRRSGELQCGAAPAVVAGALEAGGQGAGALAVPHVRADLDDVAVDEARVPAEDARPPRLDPPLPGLVPPGAGDELGTALQVLVDLA